MTQRIANELGHWALQDTLSGETSCMVEVPINLYREGDTRQIWSQILDTRLNIVGFTT